MPRRSERTGNAEGGSITLFLALTLTLVLSFCFSLLEAARVQGLSHMAQRRMQMDLESAFGEYNAALWQDYQLLFLDGSYGTGQLDLALLEGHIMEESDLEQKGVNFFQMGLKSIEVAGYTLSTDHQGNAFKVQACHAAQEQLAAGAADALKEKLEMGEKMAAEKEGIGQKWNQAKDAVLDAEKIDEQKNSIPEEMPGEAGKGNSQKGEKELPENPIKAVDMLKTSPILSVVVENPAEISGKAISTLESLGKRKKEAGNLEKTKQGSWEKMWFLQYLNGYYSCFTGAGEKGGKGHALDYELEYCIAGKNSDAKNLEKVVKELLLIREAGNFTTIMQDSKKQALALEMAAAAVGFTGLVPLVEAVKLGILLAWSYIESILDLRSLLAGGIVPLVKKPSDWKSDISLGWKSLEQKKEGAGEAEDGWGYREYLLLLLLLVKEGTLVYRAMDVVEQNIRLLPEGKNFRMDHQLYRVKAEGLYVSQPLFLGFLTVGKKVDGAYHFYPGYDFSY